MIRFPDRIALFTKPVLSSPTDVIRNIRDPEKPETLEELDVVYEHGVKVRDLNESGVDARDVDQPPQLLASIEFTPTVPHCSLATLIGTNTADTR